MTTNEIEKQRKIARVISAGSFGIVGMLTVLGYIPLVLCIALYLMVGTYLYLVELDAKRKLEEMEPDVEESSNESDKPE